MIKENKSLIYLAHISADHEKVKKRLNASEKPILWLYLGCNYMNLLAWEGYLGKDFERIHYAERLQEIALKWRKPYCDWIANLGEQYNGLSWWSSTIAEKNTAGYSLYHSVCYLYVALLTIREIEAPFLIIAESNFLLHRIALELGLKKRIRWTHKSFLLLEYILWVKRMIFIWTRYLISAFSEMGDAKRTKKGFKELSLASDKIRVVIHSCIDDTYFGEDGAPHDRYFTILTKELCKRKYDVVVLPWLFNIKCTRKEAFEWFRKHPGKYLIPADYYDLRDYLWAALIVIKQLLMPFGRQLFQNMDITLLVLEERLRQSCNHSAGRFVLYYRLIKRFKKIGLKLDVFIDLFENMLTEKPQMMAFKQYMPNVMTVGFQHYIAPQQLWLCLYTTVKEGKIAPHPDVIVCNSPYTRSIFAKEGFSAEKLRTGPSLRYLGLIKRQIKPTYEKNVVLVLLTLDIGSSQELIYKLLNAFSIDEGIRFFLKFHPLMPESQIDKILNNFSLPRYMIKVGGDIDKWIREAACAIVIVSTAALELFLSGLPVVLMGQETDFDMNPLAWLPEIASPPVHSSQKLRDSVLNCLNMNQAERETMQRQIKKLREIAISPVNDETIAAFVEPLKSWRFSSTNSNRENA